MKKLANKKTVTAHMKAVHLENYTQLSLYMTNRRSRRKSMFVMFVGIVQSTHQLWRDT